jgi:hypothetical protein
MASLVLRINSAIGFSIIFNNFWQFSGRRNYNVTSLVFALRTLLVAQALEEIALLKTLRPPL